MNTSIDPKKKENNSENEKNYSPREADLLTQDINSWWDKTFVFIKKTKVKTWKGIFILAFTAGVAVATIMTVSFNIQTRSRAASGANLTIFTDNADVTLDGDSNLINADILLNTNSNDVVAAKAVVNYNPSHFELVSWDTSNSIFSNTGCSYNGGQCEIINNDPDNGKITITVAKPTPGVNTDSGIVAQLIFKPLDETLASSPNITLDFSSSGDYNDSDVIKDDQMGTDILSSVQGAAVNVYPTTCNPETTTYNWSACADGTQTASINVADPAGCYADPNIFDEDLLIRNCVPELCSYTYGDFGECEYNGGSNENSDGIQTRAVTGSPEGCVENNPEPSTQVCDYPNPTCSEFTYEWSDCQLVDGEGKEYVTKITSSSPAGCNGGNPEKERNCDYNAPEVTCASFEYGDWGDCQVGGTRTREVKSSLPEGCKGGNPDIIGSCSFTSAACSDFTYGDWGKCRSGIQTRNILSSSPAGCSGGSPSNSRACKEDEDNDEKSEKEEKQEKYNDTKKPKFTDLPSFLSKKSGDVIWWKAEDNKSGVKYYKYKFNSKNYTKTTSNHFVIPKNTPKGIHILRVRVYDKAGNTKLKVVTVRIK